MQPVFTAINKVSGTDANVLILGENGTGKELVARAIHRKSDRQNMSFINVDLGAISQTLFESELFGHAKGAFTDAKEDKPGRFEIASDGTLFLDEIGNLSLNLQSKLLSVIQNRYINRVGSNKNIDINIRLICATNKDLYKMVEDGEFRQDLLYRINTVEINLPPLRNRKEDIPLLSSKFLKKFSNKYNKSTLKISDKANRALLDYNWPGNIRELQHVVERAVIMAEDKIITENDFSLKKNYIDNIPDSLNVERLEKKAIQGAIQKHNGNFTKAADELGWGRSTLYRKMKKYGI
jgi:transcriptional regulator with PAS, ATPase and Fis domain